jgi:hypothetical protein
MQDGKLKGRIKMFVVRNNEQVPSPFFRVGEPVPQSGVYRVFHAEHRVSHEVTLVAAQDFPRCSHCGNNVHFEMLHSAPEIDQDRNFSTRRLYEIPHPEEQDQQDGRMLA